VSGVRDDEQRRWHLTPETNHTGRIRFLKRIKGIFVNFTREFAVAARHAL